MRFPIPILLLTFNRPEPTIALLKKIQAVNPVKLYVSSDGARRHKMGEEKLVQEIRNNVVIFSEKTNIQTLFQDHNLGCRAAVSSAITWFFEHEKWGIILEDDCLPDISFFHFCQEMLEKHEQNEAIALISGYNPLKNANIPASYFYSRHAIIWGWATWRRAWQALDLEMKSFPDFEKNTAQHHFLTDQKARWYLLEKWRATFEHKNNSWAYSWAYHVIFQKKYSIIPAKNLIQNVGTGDSATHTKDMKSNEKVESLSFPLTHPSEVFIDEQREMNLFYATQKGKYRLWLRYFLPRKFLTWLQSIKKTFKI